MPTATHWLELGTIQEANGMPTSTGDFELVTLRDSQGVPTATIEVEVLILRDMSGQPTATVTSLIGQVTGHSSMIVLTASNGFPIATVGTAGGPIPSNSMDAAITDFNGLVTGTVTGAGVITATAASSPPEFEPESNVTFDGIEPIYFHPITPAEYIASYFIPVLLGLSLSVLAQIINSEVKSLLPFQALTRSGGAAAADSLGLNVGGMRGALTSWKLLWKFREPVSFLSDLLLWASTVIVALSSESFGAKLYGSCLLDDFHGCFLGLVLFIGPSRAIQSLLVFMLLVVIVLCFYLRRSTSGVAAPPSSIAVLGSLLQNKATRWIFRRIELSADKRKRTTQTLDRALEGWVFSLRYFWGLRGTIQYGIVARHESEQEKAANPLKGNQRAQVSSLLSHELIPGSCGSYKPGYFNALSRGHLATRAGFLIIICGYLTLILYYKLTRLYTPFESFMDDQGFGVRILFTSLGQLISFFWQKEFSCKYCSFISYIFAPRS
jgi:hypothetical protein